MAGEIPPESLMSSTTTYYHRHRDLLSPFAESAPLYVQRTSEKATLPVRSTPGAAGYDLAIAEEINNFAPGDRILVSTDLKMEIPFGFYGRIAPRSGMAWKYGVNVGAGVIDWDYRGIVKILLFNHGTEKLFFPIGTKIAQIIIEKIVTPSVVEEKVLGETVRGDGGFGSTDGEVQILVTDGDRRSKEEDSKLPPLLRKSF